MDWQNYFAERSKETSRFGAAILQADDIEAINRYIVYTKPVTKDAQKIKDEWIQWHDTLGWWDKNMSPEVYDKARNLRNRFNLANAKTEAEKEAVREIQQTGLSTEEMQGGTRRVLSTGEYATPDENLLPTSFKLGVGLTLASLAAGYIAYRMYVPNLKGWIGKKA